MNLQISQHQTVHVISLQGDLDASSALSLDNAIKDLLQQNVKKLVINCRGLDYVSSAGLGVFISYLTEFESKNVWFALMGVNEKILETLNLLGLTPMLNLIDALPNG